MWSKPVRQWQRPKKQRLFLDAYAQNGNITEAARIAGIHRQRVYDWQEKDAEFGLAFNIAQSMAGDALEAEAHRRAVEGVEEPVFQGGRQVGAVRRYSDTLLVLLLKATKPEKYRERHDVTSSGEPLVKVYYLPEGMDIDGVAGLKPRAQDEPGPTAV
jgi:transposase-like protein